METGRIIGLEIFLEGHGGWVEDNVVVGRIEVVVVKTTNTILVGVERASHALRLTLLHGRAGEGGGGGGGGAGGGSGGVAG